MKKSYQSKNLLSELDIEMLRAINKKNYALLELREHLKINPLSAKRHVKRLESLKLINRERIEKTNRAKITITSYGKELLQLFDKILKK